MVVCGELECGFGPDCADNGTKGLRLLRCQDNKAFRSGCSRSFIPSIHSDEH